MTNQIIFNGGQWQPYFLLLSNGVDIRNLHLCRRHYLQQQYDYQETLFNFHAFTNYSKSLFMNIDFLYYILVNKNISIYNFI